jgi:hypothetical protein
MRALTPSIGSTLTTRTSKTAHAEIGETITIAIARAARRRWRICPQRRSAFDEKGAGQNRRIRSPGDRRPLMWTPMMFTM